MNNFVRTQKVKLIDGMLWRIISCEHRMPAMEVAKICEDGTQLSRNIEYRGMAGWCYAEPGSVHKGYYGSWTATVEKWGNENSNLSNFCWGEPSRKEKELILSKYPEFKWVLDKVQWETATIFKAIRLWKKEPRLMETLCSMGLDDFALNGKLYTMKDRWEVVKYLSRNPEAGHYGLENIQLIRKFNAEWDEVRMYRNAVSRGDGVNFEEWRYLRSKKEEVKLYKDYRKMCMELGKDLKDPYWHYPSNLRKRHHKVMQDVKKKREAEEAIRMERYRAELERREREKQSVYSKFCRMMGKFTSETSSGKLSVFVPKSVESVQKQADALHQCLISCDYIEKVVNKKCLLVFVFKNGKPYATAELERHGRKFKLGQFNGNQELSDWQAKPDAVKALNQWIKESNLKMVA